MLRVIACVASLAACLSLAAADWPQFRGPMATGAAEGASPPVKIGPETNVAWKVELPLRSASSPIVVGRRLFLTACSGFKQRRLHVLCFDTESGKRLWERQFWATGRTLTHPTSAVAAPTPASDGRRLLAFFSSNDTIALDLEGNLLWYRGLAKDWPQAGNDIGMASSPLLAGGAAIVQIESQGESFAIAIEMETGETRWRIERDKQANWSSPALLPADGKRKASVILQSVGGATGHDLKTGEQMWSFKSECAGIPSPVGVAGRAYIAAGGVTALDFAAGSTSPEVAWDSNRLGPGASSPAVDGNRLYTLRGGVMSCGDAETGDVLWKLRLKGRHWATPLVAGGHVYCINSDGVVNVVAPGEKEGTIAHTSELGEAVLGSPAVAGDALYVLGAKHLWKFAK